MNIGKIFFVMVAACFFEIPLSASPGASNATLSYQKLDDFFRETANVNKNNLAIGMFIASTNKAVHGTNISLTIQSATRGMIPVSIAANGRILDFPQSKELEQENPPIVSNQPKGSLSLVVQIQIPMTNWFNFRYTRLGDGVAEMNKLIASEAGLAALLAPKADSVTFYFSQTNADKAKVIVVSAKGKKDFTANKNGQIKLKLEKALLQENPEVQLSAKPFAVVPDLP